MVLPAVDRKIHDFRRIQSHFCEVFLHIGGQIAAAQRHDADSLPGAVQAAGKFVEPRQFEWREPGPRGVDRPRARSRRAPVVEPQHGQDARTERGGHHYRAGAPAKMAVAGPIDRQFRAKRFLHGAGGPGQHQGPAAQALLLHLEPVPPRQVEEHLHVGSVGAVGICEGVARKTDASAAGQVAPAPPAKHNRYAHNLVGTDRRNLLCARPRRAFA